ncbi:antA/AntB antirepressor family protein [Riemerella anatipestifer]|uniref:Anta/antb antirepressor domain protein n=1 Tax=Riemerella anatipestifer (strain ATCC 11845 / DSM 15868 / JCM 9532 / NCTC 11014) TaxID=693978 RepID=E4T8T2_RIEAD|nr:antA/AntB antirepressor family protein [Riemerella anatipestifer]ADQ81346.1 AntA/AntB antirepressor domain protein [Riemerella anatipestifer ATCC 11845 = DSM 15868]ADZ13158.1 Phage anti-repressor protein [Riemerella anatipestifer RA-GD]AFD55364.1 anta/antb antirepressor domain protein [Riemerella anatipestifer ATCC 11845 = DSM 15868]MRM91997.1 phage antirepressor protein [Riemerella anatipestifer]SNV52817.1 Phage anti-repressor protein [Riemerella anatipestifer]
MNELIKITEQNGKQAVSARELHSFLESKQDFSTWIKNRIEKYGFIEEQDFTLHKFVERGTWKHEYVLSIDTAKELAMVEGNEKGKQARQYFIECEKRLKKPLSQVEIVAQSAQLLLQQSQQLETLQKEVNHIKAKITTSEESFITIAGYATLEKKRIDNKTASIIGRKVAKYCRDNDIIIGQIFDPRFGYVNTYPRDIIQMFF